MQSPRAPLRRLGTRQRLWYGIALGIASSLCLAAIALLRRRHVALRIGSVPIQHYKDALDDIVHKQPKLCKELGQLQAQLASSARWGSWPSVEIEASLRPSHDMHPVFHVESRGILLTSYFVRTGDPLYQSNPGRQRMGSLFGYLDLWYRTASALELPALVFHDGLENDFVERWTSNSIRFTEVRLPEAFLSANDARFVVFLDWLLCCATVEYVLLTDLRDVRFARSPFQLFNTLRSSYDLFANTDRNNAWMRERFSEVGYDQPGLSAILNAGVVGGKRVAMLDLLQEMVKEFDRIYGELLASGRSHISNIDMAVFNHVMLGTASKRWRVFTGTPFVGGQAQCELFFECQYFIYHKWIQPGELPPCKGIASSVDFEAITVLQNSTERPVWRVLSPVSI